MNSRANRILPDRIVDQPHAYERLLLNQVDLNQIDFDGLEGGAGVLAPVNIARFVLVPETAARVVHRHLKCSSLDEAREIIQALALAAQQIRQRTVKTAVEADLYPVSESV